MQYHQIGNKVKSLYDQRYSERYRNSDQLAIRSKDHKRMCNFLKEITKSFGYKITVLDLGVGTDRYFHCLLNVRKLIGTDISPFMLKQAHDPIRKEDITIDQIDFPDNSFDFIYSIGVLDEHSPFDLFICNKLYKLLKQNGKLFFAVVDINSKSIHENFKRRMLDVIYSLLPEILKQKINKRWKCFYMAHEELKGIMDRSYFLSCEISRHVFTAPKLKGAHYQCLAWKV